jgi:hypothetical protein
MPTFDGTGPQGLGAMTGRGMGPCGKGIGRRFGLGFCRGGRRGLSRFFSGAQTWSKTELENYKQALKEELEDVEKELADQQK